MNNLVLTKMQAQKGPQTENDAKRIEMTLADLGNRPEANEFLFRTAVALEGRKVERRDFFAGYRSQKGTLDGASRAWAKFKRETPLVGRNPNTGKQVFFGEFKSVLRSQNPGATDEQILDLWRRKYR